MEQGSVTAGREGECCCHPGQLTQLSSLCTSACTCLCMFLCLALLCRETKDCQDLEALQVLWESQAR